MFGERLAAQFLADRGARIVARNVRAGRGEIDLLVRFGRQLAAVEVKTRHDADPLEAFTPEKARRVREAAARLRPPVHRIDLVAVRLTDAGVEIRWQPRAA